ncbi:MAG: signal peptidase II [Desulfohalobiaceae bacterium]
MRPRSAWLIAILVLLLDQASKAWISSTIPPWDQESVIPGFFNLVHVQNKGAAFGFLGSADGAWQQYFFVGAGFLAIICISYILYQHPRRDTWFISSLGLILGGAMGNLLDRIRTGFVLDFLDLYLGSLHWPAFNIADAALSCGALLMLTALYIRKSHVSSPG